MHAAAFQLMIMNWKRDGMRPSGIRLLALASAVAARFIFQRPTGAKFVQVLPASATGSVAIVNPKPAWGQG